MRSVGLRGAALAFSALALVSTCSNAVDVVSVQRAPIVGGTPAPGDDAVFWVEIDGGSCSATLIAPRTLLLAAHCLERGLPQSATNAAHRQMSENNQRYSVVNGRAMTRTSDAGFADLALVLLDRPPTHVTPAPWVWWPEGVSVGTPVRHVGYGESERAPLGERRSVVTAVTGVVEDKRFGLMLQSGRLGEGLCFGDSGGPAFLMTAWGERVAAVGSFISAACGSSVSSSVLVSPSRHFVETWLSEYEEPQCARDARCVLGCAPPDPDCACGADGRCEGTCAPLDDPDCGSFCGNDGLCLPRTQCPLKDADCVADGAACDDPLQCADRLCVAERLGARAVCARRCEAGIPCPALMTCDAVRGTCISSSNDGSSPHAPCTTDADCDRRFRCAPQNDELRCVRACLSHTDCLDGAECQNGLCAPKAIGLPAAQTVEGPGATGALSCQSGLWSAPVVSLGLLFSRRRRPTSSRRRGC
jgi:hypothetical protein